MQKITEQRSVYQVLYIIIYILKKYESFIKQSRTRLFSTKRFGRISPFFNGKIFKKEKKTCFLQNLERNNLVLRRILISCSSYKIDA